MDFTALPGNGLLTDLYELTMAQAYLREGKTARAVFTLFPRKLTDCRNYLVACGLDDALSYLEHLRFTPENLEYLRGLGMFGEDFLDWLADFSFSGDVRAVPEGTVMFAGEPFLEVSAPIAEAQVVETMLINRIHAQTLAASKCARIVRAAAGRPVVDFGLRRMHGCEAALKNARAFRIAGAAATSIVLAGAVYGVPVAGTMAHSYIQSHDSEYAAFKAFAATYPDTVLLVDTYDTMGGVENVIRLARELGDAFRIQAVRLDSGDMADLSIRARKRLDEADLTSVGIFASGNLDEYAITDLLARGARIDAFGVGTLMGVSADAPTLDFSYKLTSYAGQDRVKLSRAKRSLPGPQQVFRLGKDGMDVGDIVAGAGEDHPGRPLLVDVMQGGRRVRSDAADMTAAAARLEQGLARLDPVLLGPDKAPAPYPVQISPALLERRQRIVDAFQAHPQE